MQTKEKIRANIQELAQRRKNVTFDEIESVVNHLRNYLPVKISKNGGHVLFNVGGRRFGICKHKQGSKQLKPVYVDNFLRGMADLGLYEED